MLSDIIAPGRLRDGEPQALAALVAVGGWAVAAYCERAGAGDGAARAVVLAFVTFRRRAIEAGDGAGAEFELMLLESARDAVDEVRGEAPGAEESRAADEAFARASPRPLSPRLATQALSALVQAAPVQGDPADVLDAAQRSYAEAYGAAQPAAAVAGEQDLGPAGAPLLAAAQSGPAAPAAPTPAAPAPEPAAAPGPRPRRAPAAPPLAARLRAIGPARRAAAFAVALVLAFALAALLAGGDEPPSPTATPTAAGPRTVTVTTTTTTPAAAPAARSQVVRGVPRRPFSASGARFEVVPISNAPWAREIRDEQPRRGSRWVTIAVRTRNVSRRDLVLRTLGYRLRTSRGVVLGARVLDVAEGPRRAREGRLPVRARASVHLGFEVPMEETGSLSIAFEPGGLDEPTVLVVLGAQSS